jgi:hypothetical protein
MIEQFLDAIAENRDKYASGKIAIQHFDRSWTKTWILWPRKTVYGRWVLPGQTTFKYHHEDMCFRKSKEQFKSGSMYQSWFFLYLTEEEYTMLKLHDSFKSATLDSQRGIR